MRSRIFAFFLMALLAVPVLCGCSLRATEARADTLEKTIEDRLDAIDNAAEDILSGASASAPASQPPAATIPPSTGSPRLTREEAEAIALQHAGLTRDQVTGLRTEFDYDDGRPQYDVEFRVGTREYDYTIHAETGDILSRDTDRDG